MSGHEPEQDETERVASKRADAWEAKTYLFLVLASGVLGVSLVIDGLTSASYLEAGIGVLLLISTPFVARWVSGAMEPGPKGRP